MSLFQFQDEKVECFCFENQLKPNLSGLKPASLGRQNKESKHDSRLSYSSDMKKQKQIHFPKTSLRREKPRTAGSSQITLRLEQDLKPDFERAYFDKRESIESMSANPARNQPRQSSAAVYMKNIGASNINLWQQPIKPHTQIRNYYNSRYNFQPAPNIILKEPDSIFFKQSPVIVQSEPTVFRKSFVKTQKISLNNLQKIEELPIHEISDFKEKTSRIYHTPRKYAQSPSQASKGRPTSFQNNKRISLTPRQLHQSEYPSGIRDCPNRLYLKEIQSVLDENERFDDEMSEVIGRGWQEREQDFSPLDLEKLKTETIGTSASNIKNSEMFGISESICKSKRKTETIGTSASNIKNSEIANSAFVGSQTLMRWA